MNQPTAKRNNLLLDVLYPLIFLVSLALVGLGQPAQCWWCGVLTAAFGYALIWFVSIQLTSSWKRFWLGLSWFALVQAIQLFWLISHPYLYIYIIYIFLSLAFGAQFGLLCALITPDRIRQYRWVLGIAGLWVFLEWSRLYFFSGFPWNPVGLALASSLYSLQMASLVGVYGLSFWVILVNLLALRILTIKRHALAYALWLGAFSLPFIYGAAQLAWHLPALQEAEKQPSGQMTALLVQTAFPAEEAIPFPDRQAAVTFVMNEWKVILQMLQKHQGKAVDLILLPEYVVPFGTYYPVFSHAEVARIFQEVAGVEGEGKLPRFEAHLAKQLPTDKGELVWMVNNAFWIQAIADLFHADVVAGLEDRDQLANNEMCCFSSAFHFSPGGELIERYEKRILVPMGEYIPFAFLRSLAARYGITGSFTCGEGAKLFSCPKAYLGTSICYEEIYGHLMRENRMIGAELLVNLTNDGWYPHSSLPWQHFEHARLRTVEMGVPMARSCNTGMTGACDALGRTVAVLGEHEKDPEGIAEALFVQVPLYSYKTLYTFVGDWLILSLSGLFLLFAVGTRKK